MEESPEPTQSFEILSDLAQLCSVPYKQRSVEENQNLISLLQKLRFFHKCIIDEQERKEFIKAAAPYVKYSYFPRGAAICHEGDFEPEFGIILEGKAIVYQQKEKSEIEFEARNQVKANYFRMYWDYLERRDFSKYFRKLVHSSTNLQRLPTLLSQKSMRLDGSTLQRSQSLKMSSIGGRNIDTILEKILDQSENIITGYKRENDLSFEEKLLLVNHNAMIKGYFVNGVATHKKLREVKDDDFISKLALTMLKPCANTIIAAEDVHLISLKTENFFSLFERVTNLQAKKEFLASILPGLSNEDVTHLSAQLEEKVYVSCEAVYREEDEPDAIYIVKKGEVQLVVHNKDEEDEPSDLPCNVNRKSRKGFRNRQKLVLCSIQDGGIFGEEEVVNAYQKRKYSAICNSNQTLLYKLKSEVYHEILKKYMPGVCKVFGETLDGKLTFRKRYEEIQKQLSLKLEIARSSGTENTTFKVINVRVMNETEAKYRKMDSCGAELVYETQQAQVITCEKRQSRILSGMVSITTYDTGPKIDPETQKESNDIQSIKTKLFRQNQQQFLSFHKKRLASVNTQRKLVHSKSMKVSPIIQKTDQVFFPHPVTEYYGMDVKPLTPKPASSHREGTTFGWSTMRSPKAESDKLRQKTEADTKTPVKPFLKFTFSDAQGTCAEDASKQMSEVKKTEASLTPKALQTLKRISSAKGLRRMPSLDSQGATQILNRTMSTIDKRMLCDTNSNSEISDKKPSSREGILDSESEGKNSAEETLKTKVTKDVEIAVSQPKIFIMNRGNMGPTVAMVRPILPRNNLGMLGKKMS